MEIESFTIPRTGDVALTFSGKLLSQVSTKTHQGPTQNRWFDLRLFRTNVISLVGAITYSSSWQSETEQHFADVFDDSAAARKWFRAFDPCSVKLWQGQREYPNDNGDAARRNEYNRNAIKVAYGAAVSELLSADEFAVTVADETKLERARNVYPMRGMTLKIPERLDGGPRSIDVEAVIASDGGVHLRFYSGSLSMSLPLLPKAAIGELADFLVAAVIRSE